jgi:hypothetical protein
MLDMRKQTKRRGRKKFQIPVWKISVKTQHLILHGQGDIWQNNNVSNPGEDGSVKLVRLFCAVAHVLCTGVYASVYDDDGDIYVDLNDLSEKGRQKVIDICKGMTEEERFQQCSSRWKSYCEPGSEGFNSYDTEPLKLKLLSEVDGDPAAKGAMDLFLESNKFWELIDYCVDKIEYMNGENKEKFKEILILLAPGVISTRNMKKVVILAGKDQKDVTVEDIKHPQFCLDMFFYAAVKNGYFGRYAMAKMCVDAYEALRWRRVSSTNKEEVDVETATFDGICFDDWPDIYYCVRSIWPNWCKRSSIFDL